MPVFRLIALLSFTMLAQGGCSVAMALSGQPEPDILMMTPGTTRADVEVQLGALPDQRTRDDGTVEYRYEYTTGTAPNVGRAVIHGAFNALSLGIWEIAGIGIESAVDRPDSEVIVVYDEHERVVSIDDRELAQRDDEAVVVVDDDSGFE